MPTVLVHPVAAVGLAPIFQRHYVTTRVLAVGMACTIIPDLDVIGLRLGIPYDALLGHRGLSHSLAFAAFLAAVLTLLLRRMSFPEATLSVFAFLFLCTASHGVLDACTNGGHGVAFLAPFSNARYFFPWRPITVAPLSVSRFLSGRAVPVLSSELRWVVVPWAIFGMGAWLVRRKLTLSPQATSRHGTPEWSE